MDLESYGLTYLIKVLAGDSLCSTHLYRSFSDNWHTHSGNGELYSYWNVSTTSLMPNHLQKLKQRSYRKYGSPPPPTPPWQAGFEVSGPNCSLSLADLLGTARICNSWASVGKDSSGNFLARYGRQCTLPLYDPCSPISQLPTQHLPLR